MTEWLICGGPLQNGLTRIETLLAFHKIRLLDQTDVLVVELRDTAGKAHVLTAAPTND